MSDLIPCPFCGGEATSSGVIRYTSKHEARWNDGSQIRNGYYCKCKDCGVTNAGLFGHQTPAIAITKWNQRK